MRKISIVENKAHQEEKRTNRNTLHVSHRPLSIGMRGKENKIEHNIKWKTRRTCLLHGERFQWKNRCRRCSHLIMFQVRLN